MEDLVDLIATDASSSDISDRLKDILYTKSAERIEALKPHVANSVFDEPTDELEVAPDEQTIEEPTEQEEE